MQIFFESLRKPTTLFGREREREREQSIKLAKKIKLKTTLRLDEIHILVQNNEDVRETN